MQSDADRKDECDNCGGVGTHVRVSKNGAEIHPEGAIVFETLCDECYDDILWIHEADE
jgi:hypothetical protein